MQFVAFKIPADVARQQMPESVHAHSHRVMSAILQSAAEQLDREMMEAAKGSKPKSKPPKRPPQRPPGGYMRRDMRAAQ